DIEPGTDDSTPDDGRHLARVCRYRGGEASRVESKIFEPRFEKAVAERCRENEVGCPHVAIDEFIDHDADIRIEPRQHQEVRFLRSARFLAFPGACRAAGERAHIDALGGQVRIEMPLSGAKLSIEGEALSANIEAAILNPI